MDTTKETLKALGAVYCYDRPMAKAYNESRNNRKKTS